MSWTDERIELLKKRWADGHSASQIAAELGGVTRNAVIGKVHRLKLESRIKTAPADETPQPTLGEAKVRIAAVAEAAAPAAPAPVAQAPAASVPHLVASAPAPSTPRPAMQPTARAVGATALKMEEEPTLEPAIIHETNERQSAEIVPISRNLTLVQLSERTCKWPLGDPLSPDFRFCGNHSGDASPYCQYHARLAFQPVSERRRVR